MIIPHLYVDDLELIDINLKNKLIGWASKNGKVLALKPLKKSWKITAGYFTIAAVLDGEQLAVGKGL